METFRTLCFLNPGDRCRIYTLDKVVPFFEGTIVKVHVEDYAEDTFVLLKIPHKLLLVKINDSNIDHIERE